MTFRAFKNMTRAGLTATAVLLLVATGARGGDLSFSGYLKNYSSVYQFPSYRLSLFSVDPPPLGSVSNRLRVTARWKINPYLGAEAAYEPDARIQDRALFALGDFTGAVGKIYRVDDLDLRLYPAPHDSVRSFALLQNLDRAHLDLHVGRVDLYAGRQAIAWGAARVINPTDILAPYSYATLDTEDRVGVDALRARISFGFMSELDLGLVGGEDLKSKHSAAYVRYKTNYANTDLTTLVVGFRENLMLGFDLARAIGGAGSWIEGAWVKPKLFQPNDAYRPDSYWRLSLGADYNFGSGTYVFIEYHYNQAGASEPADYLRLAGTVAYTDGAVYLLGEHYLAPGVTHQITPLLTAAGNLLWNLSDGSAYVSGSLDYSLAENVFLAGGVYIAVGPGPSGPAQVRSEFGLYPQTFYTSFRYYF